MSKTMFPATALRSTPSFGGELGLLGTVAQVPSRVFATLLIWQARADQRARLADMERHRLEDVGITRAQARREAGKPFWLA